MTTTTHDARPVAIVTGSARRLGRALAEALIAEGWRVVVHARSTERAQRAAHEMGAALGVGGDLSDADVPAALIEEVASTLGRIDLLVNSAASFTEGAASALSYDDAVAQWHTSFDLNTRAPMLLSIAARPHLTAARGAIINISDRAATEHWATRPLHSASKAALDSLTVSMARSLAPDVAVYGIAPNAVLPPDDMSQQEIAALAHRAGGAGTPADVVRAMFGLLADRTRSGETVVLTRAAPVPFTSEATKGHA